MISSNTVLAFYDPKYGRLNVSKFAKLKVVVAKIKLVLGNLKLLSLTLNFSLSLTIKALLSTLVDDKRPLNNR